jgi:hypothetical protein
MTNILYISQRLTCQAHHEPEYSVDPMQSTCGPSITHSKSILLQTLRSEVITTVDMKTAVFRDETICSLIDGYQRLGWICYLFIAIYQTTWCHTQEDSSLNTNYVQQYYHFVQCLFRFWLFILKLSSSSCRSFFALIVKGISIHSLLKFSYYFK